MTSLSQAQQYPTGNRKHINEQWSQIHHGSFIFHVNGCSDEKDSLNGITSPTVLCSHAVLVGYQLSLNSPRQLKFTCEDMSNGSSKGAGWGQQRSRAVLQSLQTPTAGLHLMSSLLPSQGGYNTWQSHFYVATQAWPQILPAYFNERRQQDTLAVDLVFSISVGKTEYFVVPY